MSPARPSAQRPRNYSRWRAASLAGVYLLMTLHVLHWKWAGKTLAPLELNEVMYTLELGIVTAGFLFMMLAVLTTLIFGRFFCSWGCHILALEDLCAWLLAKVRIRPKPVRSRVLMLVPFVAMLYMFAWPQVSRVVRGEPMPVMKLQTDAQGWASFTTTNFWRNLPGPGVTLLTFAVCGFAIVYFLGSRAFCTYACPYGAVFSLADRLAPGRIVAKGDCSGCGICTAACQSRVRVHEEAVEFGRIVNPACLKDLDCVAACPNGALTYGFSLPAIVERKASSRLHAKPYDFTLAEDALIGAVFLASLFVYRGLYQAVPFLMTLAVGGILGYVAVLALRLFRLRHVKINNFQLKIAGGLTRAGRAFVAVAMLLAVLAAHSAYIRYHEYVGHRLYVAAQESGERMDDAAQGVVMDAIRHLEQCRSWGLFRPISLLHRLAALHASAGQHMTERNAFGAAVDHLRQACALEPNVAVFQYNLGVLLAHVGRSDEAIGAYRRAMAIDPNDPDIQNNFGFLLAQRGELDDACEYFRRAIELKPDFAHPHFNLGRILQMQGKAADASRHFETAVRLDPSYGAFLTVSPVGDARH